jgi:predicted dehydrogenase
VEAGLFGTLILGEARLKWWRGAKYYEGWHGTWKLDGGGALMNQTVHNVDVLQWIMGEVESVTAQYGVFAHKIETEDLTAALLRFRNGAMGTILATTTYPTSAPTRMEFHGTQGAAVIEGNNLHSWYAKKDFEETIPAPNPESFAYTHAGPRHIFDDMVRVVRDEGLKSLEIVLAAYKSAQTGKPVKLPLKSARVPRK